MIVVLKLCGASCKPHYGVCEIVLAGKIPRRCGDPR